MTCQFDERDSIYDWWKILLPPSEEPTILYYFFELTGKKSGGEPDQDFYIDDDPKFYGGGTGMMSENSNYLKSFQITIYDPEFRTPEWMQRGLIYQIFLTGSGRRE